MFFLHAEDFFHILRRSVFLRRKHMPGAWFTEYISSQLYLVIRNKMQATQVY